MNEGNEGRRTRTRRRERNQRGAWIRSRRRTGRGMAKRRMVRWWGVEEHCCDNSRDGQYIHAKVWPMANCDVSTVSVVIAVDNLNLSCVFDLIHRIVIKSHSVETTTCHDTPYYRCTLQPPRRPLIGISTVCSITLVDSSVAVDLISETLSYFTPLLLS